MNPGFTYYMPFGLPATGYFNITSVPAVGTTITVGSRTYVYGTHFFGGDTFSVAKSLTAAVNASRNNLSPNVGDPLLSNPINEVFASYVGTRVYIISTVPGTTGNSLSMLSSALSVVPSGAYLTGGTASGASGGASSGIVNPATSGVFTSQTSLAANANRLFWVLANHYPAPLKFKLGAGCAAEDFSDILQQASATDAGDGGTWADAAHKGEVSVFSPVGYRYTFIEFENAP